MGLGKVKARLILYETIREMKHKLTLALWILTIVTAFALDTIPQENWKLAQQYLDQQKDFAAIVMVGSGGETRINQGYGYADRANMIPFSDKTLSTIGSITKPFTATAILLLMDKGMLSVNDPISKYFENVPSDKMNITLHQLLTHSSGLPGAIGDDYESISTLDFQKRTWEQKLLFEPGIGYEYSNVGYSLLGMIIEKVSEQTYSSFLAENIFKPAGMQTAGYSNPKADYKNLSHGYLHDGNDWGTSHDKNWNGEEPYWHLKANGGILMSANDMYQWYLALRDHKVLSPALLKIQTTPYVEEGGGSFYGYGYALDPEDECVQHNGGNRIFKADFRWFPKLDMFLFASTNDANVRLFRLTDEIIRILKTGELPQIDSWTSLSLDSFPSNENQFTAKAFIDMVESNTGDKVTVFIPEYFTPASIERNGIDGLQKLFNTLHNDIKPGSLQSVAHSGEKIQVVMLAKNENARLKITLSMVQHKIDKLEAVMEGI